jgi:hypothetical protein
MEYWFLEQMFVLFFCVWCARSGWLFLLSTHVWSSGLGPSLGAVRSRVCGGCVHARVKFSALVSRIGFGCVSYSLRVVTRSRFDFPIWLNSVPFSLRESRGQRQVSVLTTGLSIHEFFCSLDCLRRFSSFSSKVFAAAFFSCVDETAPKDSCSFLVPTTQLPVVISGLGSSR